MLSLKRFISSCALSVALFRCGAPQLNVPVERPPAGSPATQDVPTSKLQAEPSETEETLPVPDITSTEVVPTVAAASDQATAPTDNAPDLPPARLLEPQRLPEGTTVLHVGDSFAGALGYELNRQLKEHQVKGILKYKTSTYIPTWAWNAELPQYIRRYKPDLVVITLGANELKIPDPEARASTLKRLVKRLRGTPCLWVGIPLWEGSNPHLMRVIEENTSPCRFLDSVALYPDMPRAKDKIHPSKSAREEWARRVIGWIQNNVAPPEEHLPWVWKAPPSDG